jgi:dTDP-4-dehydrorhamnose 3,5-epimerase
VKIKALTIPDTMVLTPKQFSDSRGTFFEWFQDSTFFENTGHSFNLSQANCSISQKGVVRGIHYADIPPGQAKYVTCVSGSVLDVLVDLRIGSPTFGKWDSVLLEMNERKVVYLPSGIGHAFMSLEDNTTVVYLCDQRYNPTNEHEIHPLDPTIGIKWPDGIEPLLSDKDAAAPSFESVKKRLPRYSDQN